MTWGYIGGAAVSVVGGALLGGSGSESTSGTQNSIDPRMDPYIYGTDGKGGILNDARDWYNTNKSGLNDQMRQGLNQQWQTLNDPTVMGGFRQQQNLGSGLMSAPVMGNPFSDGRVSLMSGRGGMGQGAANLGLGGPALGGSPTQSQYPSYQPVYGGGQPPATASTGPFAAPAPAPVAPPPPAASAPTLHSSPYGDQILYGVDGDPMWLNGYNLGNYETSSGGGA